MCGHHHHRTTTLEPPAGDGPDLRVADTDREATAEVLRSHAGEGRLDVAELEARLERTYAARTFADLQALTADLPRPTPDARQELREHLRSYLLVMALLVAIWAATDFGGYFWPIWPMLGWGIGVASHAGGVSRGRARRRPAPRTARA